MKASHLCSLWTTQTLSPASAAKPLRWCWEHPTLSMEGATRALALFPPLVLALLHLAPTHTLGICPSACRCSFATLLCVETDAITSIPTLAAQESENMTEMWVWRVTCPTCVLPCLYVGGLPGLIFYVSPLVLDLCFRWLMSSRCLVLMEYF